MASNVSSSDRCVMRAEENLRKGVFKYSDSENKRTSGARKRDYIKLVVILNRLKVGKF